MVESVRKSWAALLVGLLLVACLGKSKSLAPRRSYGIIAVRPTTTHLMLKQLQVRGGTSDNSDEDDGEESEESVLEEIEGEASSVLSTVNSLTKRFVIVLGKSVIAATKAGGRAIKAAFQGDDVEEDEEEEPPSFMTRTVRTVKRMWFAAWDTGESEDESAAKRESSVVSDFGSYLEDSYSLSVDRGEEPTTVMGGTIGDALREARSEARLLVVFIPSARPGRGKKQTPDHEAIASLLSPEVAEVAEKRARRKHESGSFVVWGAKASSPEAVTAIKRLKAKQSSSKGDKRPVLVVAYPAQVRVAVALSYSWQQPHYLPISRLPLGVGFTRCPQTGPSVIGTASLQSAAVARADGGVVECFAQTSRKTVCFHASRVERGPAIQGAAGRLQEQCG